MFWSSFYLHPLQVMLEVMDCLNEFGSKYTFAVSLQFLLVLTFVKMLMITKNKTYNISAMQKMCACLWVVNAIAFGILYWLL